MKRFEVWLTEFDPTKGAEIQKTRPSVIVSPDSMNNTLRTIIVAQLTSTVKGYPMRIASSFQDNGGEIVLDQIRCVDKSRLIKKIGKLDTEEATAICQILTIMFQE